MHRGFTHDLDAVRDEVSKGDLEVVGTKGKLDPVDIAVAGLDPHLIRIGVLDELEVEADSAVPHLYVNESNESASGLRHVAAGGGCVGNGGPIPTWRPTDAQQAGRS